MIFGCCKSKGLVSAALYGFINELRVFRLVLISPLVGAFTVKVSFSPFFYPLSAF
jgi:hypothetical protein